ncbi:MAG: acyl carrier protein [Rhizobiaceae bacterium]|jgi:acyl carrier protein|nr:acyl carrier protein [Rhizobiaceae bacterium]
MLTSEIIHGRVHAWILEQFPLAAERTIGANDKLLDSGIVDSLGTLEIVNFIEQEFGVPVADEDMLADHFETVDAISRFVCSKALS